MHLTSRRSASPHPSSPPRDSTQYSILSFGNRSEAVRYCLRVSTALGDGAEDADVSGDCGATLWLAAAAVPGGACAVFANDRALAAARGAGLDVRTTGRIRHDAMPAARCLVLGSAAALVSD